MAHHERLKSVGAATWLHPILSSWVNEAAPAPIIASGNGMISISTWLDAEDLEIQIVLSHPIQMTRIGHI